MSKAISLPFSFDSNGGVAYTTDDRKIWQDRVVLAVMTYFGERVMRPNYGSSVEEATFENTTTAISMINQAIAGAFSFWLPDLALGKVEKILDVSSYLIVNRTALKTKNIEINQFIKMFNV